MQGGRGIAIAIIVGLFALAHPCISQAQPGDGARALPGFLNVTVPDIGPPRIAAALDGGYGLIEPIRDGDGNHHRLYGSLAVSVRPWDYISLWVHLLGRYDMHPDDGMPTSDDSLVGEPRFGIRGGADLGGGVRLGADFGLWLPGADAPSVVTDAISFTARGLGSWTVEDTGLTIGLDAGFRFDQSGTAVTSPELLRSGDQISLGASSFHAVVLGGGASYREADVEVFGEVRWSLLIDAPALRYSPAHVGLGGRFFLPAGFSLELNARVGLSARRDPMVSTNLSQELIPIEPRFSAGLGLRWAFGFEQEETEEEQADDSVEPSDDPDQPPTDLATTVTGTILDDDGQPVAAAAVTAEGPDGFSATTETDRSGRFSISGAPTGAELTLRVDAEGFEERELTASGSGPVSVTLEARVPRGALRGLVRDYRSRPLAATITVTPGDHQVETDAEGAFEIELPEGSYDVVISAPRMREQRRSVEVEDNGVVILNADLHRRRRGR